MNAQNKKTKAKKLRMIANGHKFHANGSSPRNSLNTCGGNSSLANPSGHLPPIETKRSLKIAKAKASK
jgi:hypothetical protein